jgi:hypothetical protein
VGRSKAQLAAQQEAAAQRTRQEVRRAEQQVGASRGAAGVRGWAPPLAREQSPLAAAAPAPRCRPPAHRPRRLPRHTPTLRAGGAAGGRGHGARARRARRRAGRAAPAAGRPAGAPAPAGRCALGGGRWPRALPWPEPLAPCTLHTGARLADRCPPRMSHLTPPTSPTHPPHPTPAPTPTPTLTPTPHPPQEALSARAAQAKLGHATQGVALGVMALQAALQVGGPTASAFAAGERRLRRRALAAATARLLRLRHTVPTTNQPLTPSAAPAGRPPLRPRAGAAARRVLRRPAGCDGAGVDTARGGARGHPLAHAADGQVRACVWAAGVAVCGVVVWQILGASLCCRRRGALVLPRAGRAAGGGP